MYEDFHMAWAYAFLLSIIVGEPYAILSGGPKGFTVVRESIALRPRIQQYVIEVVS